MRLATSDRQWHLAGSEDIKERKVTENDISIESETMRDVIQSYAAHNMRSLMRLPSRELECGVSQF
jgi:hypothetical protein